MAKMSRKIATNRYLQLARVTGRGAFPLDMLRYDACHPRTGDDVSALHATFQERGTRSVVVCRFSQTASEAWTSDRWFSFGWALQEIPA